jgi:muconolactone D-isomerase
MPARPTVAIAKADNDALHELLWALPLFPYMNIEVIALAHHPSTI